MKYDNSHNMEILKQIIRKREQINEVVRNTTYDTTMKELSGRIEFLKTLIEEHARLCNTPVLPR